MYPRLRYEVPVAVEEGSTWTSSEIRTEATPEEMNEFLLKAREKVQKLDLHQDVQEDSVQSERGTAKNACTWCGGTHKWSPSSCTRPKKGSNVAGGDGNGSGAGISNCPICGGPHKRRGKAGHRSYTVCGPVH